jgi:hypothetical protein
MSERNVISGTRRTMRELVDGTIRVQIDIDPEFHDDFHRLFGQVDMAVAIAPLNLATSKEILGADAAEDNPPMEDERTRSAWKDLGPLAQSAILLCKDEKFQQFVVDKWKLDGRGNEHIAAEYVKTFCKVDSRKDLDTADGGRTRFGALMADYRQWQS